MNLKIYQETKPVSGSNWLVAAIYDPDAPAVVVAQYAFPKPYTGQTQLVHFDGIDDIVYTYICWESATTAPGGSPRNNFEIQPSNNAFTVREDLFLEADITPGFTSGTNFYGPDSSLIGWDWYYERIPLGTQQPDIDYVKTVAGVDTGISNTAADGFRLGAVGDVFGPNEKGVIHFYPQVAVSTNAPTAKIIVSTQLLTANTILDNTAVGKSFLLQGAGGYFEVTLPDLGTVQDNKPLFFLSSGGSHINVGIKCFGSQTYQWSGPGSNTKIKLAQNEQMLIYKWTFPDTSTRWLVAQISDTVRTVGEIILSYSKIEQNTLFLDGNQSVSRTNYSRAWDFVNSLDSECVVTGAQWGHTVGPIDGVTFYDNKGKFSTGDGSSTFGLPLIYNYGFLRFVQGSTGTNKAGRLEVGTMFDHQHEETIGTLSGPNLFGTGVSRNKGNYNGRANGLTDLVSKAGMIIGGTYNQMARTGPENRPDNIGIYALMRI